MTAAWLQVPFNDALVDVSKAAPIRLTSNEYLTSGSIPIIDQGAKPVAGYWSRSEDAVKVTTPLIIFGDHTKALKLVDYDFCVGAEGVKILEPQCDFDANFLFQFLRTISLPEVGYSRHFKFLQRVIVPKPPLDEQRRIAAILDQADDLRRKRRAADALVARLLSSYFIERFGDPLQNFADDSLGRLGDFCTIKTGKLDANKAIEKGQFPFFTCAVEPLRIDVPAFEGKAALVAGNGDLNVKYFEGKFNAYQRTYVIQSKDEGRLATRLIAAFLSIYVDRLRALSIGGVIKYIKLENLTEARIKLPTSTEQADFIRFADAHEEICASLKEATTRSTDLFRCLQHHAFAGTLEAVPIEATFASVR